MRRVLHLVAVVLIAAFEGSPASAAVDRVNLDGVRQAASDFLARAKDSHMTGQPPRESDPAVKALLDTILDTAPLAAQRPLPLSEVDTLSEWNRAILAIGDIYLRAGTGAADAQAVAAEPAVALQMLRNTAEYAPELGRYFDATFQTTHAMIEMLMHHLVSNPQELERAEVLEAVVAMRRNLVQFIGATLIGFRNDLIDDDWRRERLPSLTGIAPAAASFLSAEERRTLQALALDVAGDMEQPDIRSAVTLFGLAFAPQTRV